MLRAHIEDSLDEASAKTGCSNLVLGSIYGRYLSGSHSGELLRGAAASVTCSKFPFAAVIDRRAR